MVSHKKQVKRLKKDAQRLWSDQQALLTRANSVARDAIPHAQRFAKGTLDSGIPGARTIVAEKVAPVVGKAGKAAGSYAASTGKDALTGVLLPAVSSARVPPRSLSPRRPASRLGLSDIGHRAGQEGHRAARQGDQGPATSRERRAARSCGPPPRPAGSPRPKATGKKKGLGVGGVLGILLGVGLLAGIGYAVWQTLRADDDLWVADEDPETKA